MNLAPACWVKRRGGRKRGGKKERRRGEREIGRKGGEDRERESGKEMEAKWEGGIKRGCAEGLEKCVCWGFFSLFPPPSIRCNAEKVLRSAEFAYP